MNKPITVAFEDFKKKLTDAINDSGLPMFVIESVLHAYITEVADVAKKQYQFEKERYEDYLLNSNEDKSKVEIESEN